MKKLLKSIGVAATVLATVLMVPFSSLADSYSSYYINTTNIVSVLGTNCYANAIIPVWTNNFNLSTTTGSQASTNLWPALAMVKQDNMFFPSRLMTLQYQFNAMAANTGTLTMRWASSVNGTIWQTNPCPLVTISTANGTTFVQQSTNVDSAGIQFYSLMTAENTGAAAITNIWVGTGFNRGL
jgi:hypothetical protein